MSQAKEQNNQTNDKDTSPPFPKKPSSSSESHPSSTSPPACIPIAKPCLQYDGFTPRISVFSEDKMQRKEWVSTGNNYVANVKKNNDDEHDSSNRILPIENIARIPNFTVCKECVGEEQKQPLDNWKEIFLQFAKKILKTDQYQLTVDIMKDFVREQKRSQKRINNRKLDSFSLHLKDVSVDIASNISLECRNGHQLLLSKPPKKEHTIQPSIFIPRTFPTTKM